VLARVLEGEGRAGEQRPPGDHHQRDVDDQRHVGRKEHPAKTHYADCHKSEEGQGDRVKNFQGMVEELPPVEAMASRNLPRIVPSGAKTSSALLCLLVYRLLPEAIA
jgi:hypothetical protein